MSETVKVLGISFFSGTPEEAIEASRQGGLIVAPSGPGMGVDFQSNAAYRRALTSADVVIADSGFMALIWNVMAPWWGKPRVARISGLRYLQALLLDQEFRQPGATLWVMPSVEESRRNLEWLRAHGFAHLGADDCYLAPDYRRAAGAGRGVFQPEDEALASLIESRKPKWVILCVGGGVQEPLGCWLRQRLGRGHSIVCTGAAIAFLTGGQVAIPAWVDRMHLGWLWRIASNPKAYFPRYWSAFLLLPVLLRWKEQLPPPQPVR